ncbi:MAG: GH25 family lysozyme [Acutalibacteraceae bacterium]
MERKSGIAAILLSGMIAFGIAGDIRPSSMPAVVSQPEAPVYSESVVSSGHSAQRLFGQIIRAAALPVPEINASSDDSGQTTGVVANKEPVVYTKEEIKEAVHTVLTEEEQEKADREDPQRVEQPSHEAASAPVIELPASSLPATSSVLSSTEESSSSRSAMAAGWHTIAGKQYYSDGTSYLTGWQTIRGLRYYFSESGAKESLAGIDVSTWQTRVDWNQLKAQGIDYAMIRVGFRGWGSGKLTMDNRFETHYQGAKAAGLKVGVYFFSEAINEQEAADEAAFTIEALKNHPIDLPVVFDIEDNQYRQKDLSRQMRTNLCISFCSAIRSAGYTPQIYSFVNYFTSCLDMSQLLNEQLWIAHVGVPDNAVTSFKYRFFAWQYTQSASVNGVWTKNVTTKEEVPSLVDLNIWIPNGIQIRVPEPAVSSETASPETGSSADVSSEASSIASALPAESMESVLSDESADTSSGGSSSMVQQEADTAHSEPTT